MFRILFACMASFALCTSCTTPHNNIPPAPIDFKNERGTTICVNPAHPFAVVGSTPGAPLPPVSSVAGELGPKLPIGGTKHD
jgi:hypothetical protein